MIPTRAEILNLILDENCELVEDGRWELYEILDFIYDHCKMTDAEFNASFRMIIDTWGVLCKDQRWDHRCRKNGWARAAQAA